MILPRGWGEPASISCAVLAWSSCKAVQTSERSFPASQSSRILSSRAVFTSTKKKNRSAAAVAIHDFFGNWRVGRNQNSLLGEGAHGAFAHFSADGARDHCVRFQ